MYLDDERIRIRRQLPERFRGPVRKHQRRIRRIRCTGILLGATGAFTPVISIRTVSGTETSRAGATTCAYELWGSGAGGGGTTGSGCAITAGGGGAGGGKTTGTPFAVTLKGGLTWTVTIGAVGAAGIAGGANGGNSVASSVNSGTMTGWNNISVPIAAGGVTGGAPGGAGAAPTNTNAGAVNTAGNAGSGINGGASIAGTITGDNQGTAVYGRGGGGHNAAGVGDGQPGVVGGAVFSYV